MKHIKTSDDHFIKVSDMAIGQLNPGKSITGNSSRQGERRETNRAGDRRDMQKRNEARRHTQKTLAKIKRMTWL